MTVSGVRSSWLASAANSRWRRSDVRWAPSEFADRDQRPLGVDPAERDRHDHDQHPADEQHGEQRLERLDLGRAVLEDLEVVGVAVLLRDDLVGEHPDRHLDRGPARSRVARRTARRTRASPSGCRSRPADAAAAVSPASSGRPVGHDDRPVADLHRVPRWRRRCRARVLPPPNTNPCSGPLPVSPFGPSSSATNGRARFSSCWTRRRLERVGDGRVQGRAEDHQHDQRRDAAPRHEAPADPPDELRLVVEGRLLRVVVPGIEPSPVSHRRAGTPRRARSPPASRPRRASCAGSGRRRRRRWA